MNSDSFYKDLPLLPSFEHVGDPNLYTEAPEDWYVVITDVKGSTKAIADGKYKEVNIAGAASVAAVLHASPGIEIPFVFGGDGASFLIPSSFLERAKKALIGAEELSRDSLGLYLRVGLVPVSVIHKGGAKVLVSKFALSSSYTQAVFSGGGFSYAEKLIKAEGSQYLLAEPLPSQASFAGLSCRWEDIQSIHGETVSLLVKATGKNDAENDFIYRSVIGAIVKMYGDDAMHHPVPMERLQISLSNLSASRNAKVRATPKNKLSYIWNFFTAKLFALGFLAVTKLNLPASDPGFKRYQGFLINAVDYRKFDDALRTVISGTHEARLALTSFLESEHKAGRILYGIHVADRAILTCLVMKAYERQVHFIDGADGGYTLAAKQLKEQIAQQKTA